MDGGPSITLSARGLAQDLPREILGEIFAWCLPDHVSDLLIPNSAFPPLVLCYVCRSWRKAALGTPQLWRELALVLGYVSVRSLGVGFLRKGFDALEFWSSHMGALSPSLHFIRQHTRVSIANEDASKFIPFRTFFECSAISNAQTLTLHGFSAPDFMKISQVLNHTTFEKLKFLVISQPSGREHSTSMLRFPFCPALRRLHLDCHTELSSSPSSIITAFPWRTITHLSANLKIRRQDWYIILLQCINLSHGSLALEFSPAWGTTGVDERNISYHKSLKALSVRGTPEDIEIAFDKLVFPSVTALRVSCTRSPTSLGTVHQVLCSTPSLNELHLQSCLLFGHPHFLRQPFVPSLSGPLSKFVPNLKTLVIDPIGYQVPATALPRDLLTLLHSSWLKEGWSPSSHTQKSIEFVLDKGSYFSNSVIADLDREINLSGPLPFCTSARYVEGGLWIWRQLNAADLRDRWDGLTSFYCP